jgi:uncharacterized peroxidase-related enzyme
MQRVPQVDPADASPEVHAIWEGVETILGRVPNAWRTIVHSPAVARWFLPFQATLHRSGTGSVLDVRIKNLVVLKTSEINRCAYCLAHNHAFGRGLGLTEEQADVLRGDDYRDSPLFDDRQKAAIWWAEEVTNNTAKFNKECFEYVREHFDDAEIVEMTLLIGMFALMNRFNDSLFIDIEPDEETQKIKRTTTLSPDVIFDYTRRMSAGGAEHEESRS